MEYSDNCKPKNLAGKNKLRTPKTLFQIDDDLSTSAIAVGDVTGSGKPELCTGGRDGVLRLYDANSETVASLAVQHVVGSILSIKIADANNDGQMEIVVGRSVGSGESPGEAGTLQVYRYVATGCLELLAEHPIDRFVTTVVVTDVTGDQRNEIMAGGSDSTLRVFKMNPDNSMTEFVKHQLDDMPIAIGTCDVIGDEIDEIVTGNRDKTLRVFKVKNSSVEQIECIELPSPVISVAAGDVLGDRKMELGVVTHDGSVRIYRNEESKLDLFSKLEDIKALSIRMAEINADHMDEIVIAASDYKIKFYNLYMADLNEIAQADIGSKILSISVGDAGGDDLKEVLVGVSDGPLKVIEGLYRVIPQFEVDSEAKTGTTLKGKVTLTNITDEPISGVSGKIYWFPKDHLSVDPHQLKFDLGPNESKTIEVQLMPSEEGTVIVRPIVLMWSDEGDHVNQVTTPETAIMITKGEAVVASAASPPVEMTESVSSQETTSEATEESASPFAPVSGTGFPQVSETEKAEAKEAAVSDGFTSKEKESMVAAEQLLDKLFGEETTGPTIEDVVTEPAVTPAEPDTVESDLVTEIRNREPKPPRPDMASDAYSFLFKTMVIGEGAVGKTTLVNRYVTGVFERDYKTTIGSQFAVKLTHISPPEQDYAIGIKLQAWDVAGQARFKAVRKMYYSGAAGVILVFDVTRKRSFKELPKWVQEADESIGMRVPMLVVGNKVDLPDRTVSSEEAKKWAEDQGFLYMESSAKTGEGVGDMFTVLAELMWKIAKKAQEAKTKKM